MPSLWFTINHLSDLKQLKEDGSLIQYMTLTEADSQAWLIIAKVTRSASEAASKFIHTRTGQKSCWISQQIKRHLLKSNCTHKTLLHALSEWTFPVKPMTPPQALSWQNTWICSSMFSYFYHVFVNPGSLYEMCSTNKIITVFIRATACRQCKVAMEWRCSNICGQSFDFKIVMYDDAMFYLWNNEHWQRT